MTECWRPAPNFPPHPPRAPQPVPAAPRVAEVAPRAPAPSAAQAPKPQVSQRETAIAVAKVRSVRIGGGRTERPEAQPSEAQPQFAVASTDGAELRQPIKASSDFGFPRFVPETGALRPSTLQEQAAHLENGAPAPEPVAAPASRAAPAPAPRTASRGAFEIQIGAYGDTAEAERRMTAARQRSSGMLDAYRGVAIPVKGGKLYRARFQGFSATAANETCSRLKTMQIECFVVKAE